MYKAVKTFILLLVIAGCQHPGNEKQRSFDGEDMNWEDLMTHHVLPPKPPDLGQLAIWFGLSKARLYEGGLYGKQGPSTYYMVTSPELRKPQRLYWTKVRVLSEKYGCFMKEKLIRSSLVVFRCKDGRSVAFWDLKGDGWQGFQAKQYDRSGLELYVDRGKLISRHQVDQPIE